MIYAIAALVALMVGAAIYFFVSGKRSGADAHVAAQAEQREDIHDEAETHLDRPPSGNLNRLLQRWHARKWLQDRDPGKATPRADTDPNRDE